MLHAHANSIKPGAAGVEFSPEDPRVPIAFRVWRQGENPTDKGLVRFTTASQVDVMRRYKDRGMAIVLDYDHESTVPPEDRRASAADGYGASSGRCKIALRNGELWAVDLRWTDRAKSQIRSEERTQISPYFVTDEKGEIRELLNIALCTEGATHRAADFAAMLRRHDRRHVMKELIAQLRATLEAIQAGGAGSIEEALAQLTALENIAAAAEGAPAGGGEEMAPPMEEVRAIGEKMDEMKQTMGRMEAMLSGRSGIAVAASRAPSADVIEARRALVGVVIEKAPEGAISADSARWLTERADPELAKRYVGDIVRLSRERPNSGIQAPRSPAGTGTAGLTEAQLRMATRHGIKPEDFAARREREKQIAAARSGRKVV